MVWQVVNPSPFKPAKAMLAAAVLALLLTGCGVEGNRFEVEGHFLKINRGEF